MTYDSVCFFIFEESMKEGCHFDLNINKKKFLFGRCKIRIVFCQQMKDLKLRVFIDGVPALMKISVKMNRNIDFESVGRKSVCQTIIKTHKDDPLEYSKGCKNKKACKHGRKSKNREEYCCSTYLCNNEPYEVSEDKPTGDRSAVFSLMTGLYAKILKNKDPSTELCRGIKTLKPSLNKLLKWYGRRERKLISDAFTKLQDEVTGSSCKQPESTCKVEDADECLEILKLLAGVTDDEKCRSILAARSCLNDALSGCEIADKTTEEGRYDTAVGLLQVKCPTFPEVDFCTSVRSFFMSPGSLPESICLSLTSEPEEGREFRIRLEVEPKSGDSPSVLIEGGCDSIFTADNWASNEGEIKFHSKIDGKRHGTKTDTVKVYGDYYKTGSSDIQTVLLDKFVIVTEYGKQKKARCSSINDPHLTTFDKTKYENFINGEFIMTKNKDQDYEVHAVYSKCSSANCNCACLIRVEKTIISFDRCPRKGRKGKKNRRLDVRIWMDETGELPKGLDIRKSKSGNKYTVELPGGTQVKVASRNAKKLKGSERRFINIRILASPVDYLSSEGLCGSHSGRKNQDFLMPDGTFFKPSTRKQKKYPNEFSRAWRVDMKKGLINGNIYVDKTGEIEQKVESQFCTCVSGKTEPEACRASVAITDVENTEEVITSTLETLSSTVVKEVAFGTRKKRQTSSTVDDLDIDVNEEPVDPEWPTPSGWTLETATNYCTEQLANDSAVSNCLKLGQSIEEEIDHCVADIQTSDGTEWASEAKDNIIENCLEAINQDPDLANNPDTKTIVDEIKALSCPDDCNSPQGTCTVEGICVCKDGYTSEDCSLSTSAVPVIDDVGSSGHCKKNSPGDCKTVAVQGENFIKSDKLTCHLEEITYTESGTLIKSGKVTQVKAVYERVDSIQCHLPFAQSTSIPVSATVTVSNDGVKTSGSMQYIAYDEECYSCTNNECKRQPNTCVIDNICYVDRETKPNQPCLYCDSSKENEWTVLNEYKCESFNNYGKEEFDIATRMGIGIGVVAFIILVIVIVLIYRRQSKSLKPKDRESIMESSSSDGYPSPLVFSNTTYNGSMNDTGDKVHKLALTPDGEKGWAHATSTPPAYLSDPEYSRIHRNVNFHESVKDGIPVRINSKEYQQTF